MQHKHLLGVSVLTILIFTLMLGEPIFSQAQVEVKSDTSAIQPDSTPSVMFIENVGQFRSGARFQSRNELGTLFLAENALWLTILEPYDAETMASIQTGQAEPPLRGGVHLRLSFVGANPDPTIEPFQPLTTSINYFIGHDSDKWYTHVPVWGGVRYRELYPGIDLELTSQGGNTVQRLVVTETGQAHLEQVQLQVEGGAGLVLRNNQVYVNTTFGEYRLPLFEVVSEQEAGLIGNPPQLNNGRVIANPFVVPLPAARAYGANPLLPSSLVYSTYIGGNDYDIANAVTVDRYGSIYVGGTTQSLDFPTTPGTFDPTPGGYEDAYEGFISKLNPNGSALEYSTYIHGNNSDYIYGMVVDASGALYATGHTRSSNFPTTPNVPTNGFGGEVDGFALKLSPNGSTLIYSMYLGGSGTDLAEDIDIMTDGVVAIAGVSASSNFPTTPNAFDPENPTSSREAFVTKIAPNGSSLLYSTYIGGSAQDDGEGVAIDSSGHVYIMGVTDSQDFPITPGAFDPTNTHKNYFVTKLSVDGSELDYSTYVDGHANTFHGDIEVDNTGYVYVTGNTQRPIFPATPGAYDTECGEAGVGCDSPQLTGDGILFKLNPTGSQLVYGTYLGGDDRDYGRKVAVDSLGNAYVIGRMETQTPLTTPGGYFPGLSYTNAIWKINPDGSELLHLSRVPGGAAVAMAIQAPDVAIYAGAVFDYYETTAGAYDTTPNGDADVGTGRLLLPAVATTTTLSVSGGTLLSPVDNTTYSFAPNTFTETVVFTHAPRHPLSLPPIVPNVTVGHTFVNYAIGSDGTTPLTPLRPYTLDIAYDESTIGVHERTLKLYYWNGSAWEIEPTAKLDVTANHFVAAPARVGWWIVAGDLRPQYLPMVTRTP